MGWFSYPNCPRCGRKVSLATAWDGDYYTCYPCVAELREEEERKQAQEKKTEALEEKVARLEKLLEEKDG